MLYKYETDFLPKLSQHIFDNSFDYNFTNGYWIRKLKAEEALVNNYLWNAADSCFYDYNCVTNGQNVLSATSFPLWASENSNTRDSDKLNENIYQSSFRWRNYKLFGSIAKYWVMTNGVSGIFYGWPPHQIIWQGLSITVTMAN
jgi:neutral trehalase